MDREKESQKAHEERLAARKAKDALRATEEETKALRELNTAAKELLPRMDRLGFSGEEYYRFRRALLAAALCGPL